MSFKQFIPLLAVALTVVASGCTNITGSFTGVPSAGTDADWCVAGQNWQSSNPQTGESVRYNIEGVVTHEGQRTCKATWTSNTDDELSRMEMYYTEDGEYQHILGYGPENLLRYEYKIEEGTVNFRLYDENGTLINEGSYGSS